MLVTGTGTGVGKTWVAAALATRLRMLGVTVVARKPAQSFEPGAGPTDAEVLAAVTGEEPAAVCLPHRSYGVAMAPPMAAEVLGRPAFTVADLVGELAWPPGAAGPAGVPGPPGAPVSGPAGTGVAVGLVEAAGGVASPQAAGGDVADLARALQPDLVLLVADAGLGTINAVRLAHGALASLAVPVVVVLDRYDPGDDLHRRNRQWLAERDGLAVLVLPGEEDALADRVLGAR